MTTTNDGTSNALPAAVVGGVAAVTATAAYNSYLCQTKPDPTYAYDLWGKTVHLSIPPEDFPTNEERERMEATMPGCEHGWFPSSFEGKQLHYRKFLPASNAKPKAIIVYHHGIQAHSGAAWIVKNGRKLSLAAQIDYYVTKNGFALYAMDQLGHGYSEGRRMFVSDYHLAVKDLVTLTQLAASQHQHDSESSTTPPPPLFLTGHSFGGCLALHVTHFFKSNPAETPPSFAGLVLFAPAIIGDLPPPPVTYLLRYVLAPYFPTWTPFFMPNTVSSHRIWRDPEVLALHTDPRYLQMGLEKAGTPFTLGTAVQLLNGVEDVRHIVIPGLAAAAAAATTEGTATINRIPICIVHGTCDYGVPCEGTDFLEKQYAASCPSYQDILKVLRVEGAYHDLFADPAMEETMDFVLQFLHDRLAKT
jgi:alpha-beta hydrolase superfamily lysophospholipase